MGSGTTLIEARLLNRNAMGYDINQKAVDITTERLNFKVDNNSTQTVSIGDVRNLSAIENNAIDLIVTHPPYANIVTYSDRKNPDDLSSIAGIPKFLEQLTIGIQELFRVLKPNRYCAVLIGDTRKAQHYVPLSHFVFRPLSAQRLCLKRRDHQDAAQHKVCKPLDEKCKPFQILSHHARAFIRVQETEKRRRPFQDSLQHAASPAV